MFKLGVLVSGGGTNLQAIIDNISSGKLSGVEIATVISNKEDAYALERARENEIDAKVILRAGYESKEAFGDAIMNYLESKQVDLVVLAGFLVILPENLVNHFKGRMINVHPALIPAFSGKGFYGIKVHEQALASGATVTGATVHIVTPETDAGPILLQKEVKIKEGDTPEILQKRVMEEAEQIILPQAIKMLSEDFASCNIL